MPDAAPAAHTTASRGDGEHREAAATLHQPCHPHDRQGDADDQGGSKEEGPATTVPAAATGPTDALTKPTAEPR